MSRPLASELVLPLFSKDVIKETWADILGAASLDGRPQREWNALLGAASGQTMWNLLAQSPCGAILESPMPSQVRHHVVAGLANANVTEPLEIWCDVPVELARKRIERRWPIMHPIHGELTSAQEWIDIYAGSEPLAIGPVLRVDTTGRVDIEVVADWCRSHAGQSASVRNPGSTALTVSTADRACAAVLRGSSILMVHHRRDGRDYWTLPGGGVEAGETPSQSAVRELAEETGLTGTVVAPLYRRGYRSRDGAQVIEHCYLMDVPACDEPALGSDPEVDDESPVLIGVSWLPVADLQADRQVRRVLDALPE